MTNNWPKTKKLSVLKVSITNVSKYGQVGTIMSFKLNFHLFRCFIEKERTAIASLLKKLVDFGDSQKCVATL